VREEGLDVGVLDDARGGSASRIEIPVLTREIRRASESSTLAMAPSKYGQRAMTAVSAPGTAESMP